MCICVCVYMCVCAYVYMYICVYVYMCMNVICTYVCMYVSPKGSVQGVGLGFRVWDLIKFVV